MTKLRIAPEPDEAEVAVGDQITVNYRGTWYPGTIVRAGDGGDGYYDVRYNDGSGWVEQNVDVSRLRALAVGAGAGPPGGPPGGLPAEGGAESATEAYTICVRALSGESTTLEVDGADTIATVKKKFDAALLESGREPMKGISLWHEKRRAATARAVDEGDIGRDCDAPVVVRGSVVARNAQVRGPVVRGRVVASHAPAVAAASNPPAARAAATATLPDQGCDLSRTAISSPALASAAAPPGSGYRAGDEVRVGGVKVDVKFS